MQPKASPVICFSWREIAATTKGRCLCPCESRDRTSIKLTRGVRANLRGLHVFARTGALRKQVPDRRSGRQGEDRIAPFYLGGELSGFKRLVYGQRTGSMRFSYR